MDTESEEYKKQRMKVARRTALVFGILAFAAMISLVYAFIQNTIAVAAKNLAIAEMENCRKLTEAAEQKLAATNLMLEKALIDAAIAKEAAEAQTKKSKK